MVKAGLKMKVIYRRIFLLIVILLGVLFLSSCWDKKELDELGVPFIVAYDYVSEEEKEYPDDKYLLSVGYPIFYEDAEKKYHVDMTPGSLIGETRSRRNTHYGEQVVLGQIQILIFGEELADHENLTELTDSVSRNPAVKGSLYMAVVEGRAADLLNVQVEHYPNPGIYIKMLLRNISKTNFFPTCTLFTYNRYVASDYTAPILPYLIHKEGDIVVAGSCFIDAGKRMEHIGRMETETAVFLRGFESRGVISFDVKENNKIIDQVSFSGANSRNIKIRREGDKYIIDIQIKLYGELVEHKKSQSMKENKDILKLSQKSLEDIIKRRTQDFVRKVKEEYGFDALDVAKEIKAHSREKLTKEDIDRIIQESEINVDVKVQIENAGGKM